MKILVRLLIRTLAISITAYLVPGVKIDSLLTAVTVVVVLGLLNTFIRPIIILFTLPVNILTLGLFTLIINTLMILLTSFLIAGFLVTSFWSAFWFGIVLFLVNGFLNALKS